MKPTGSQSSANELPPGLSQPAIRALNGAGITRSKQLTKHSEADILKLHGMGPSGIKTLKSALAAQGLAFAAAKPSKAQSKTGTRSQQTGATRR